jgi:hypothetical protein
MEITLPLSFFEKHNVAASYSLLLTEFKHVSLSRKTVDRTLLASPASLTVALLQVADSLEAYKRL